METEEKIVTETEQEELIAGPEMPDAEQEIGAETEIQVDETPVVVPAKKHNKIALGIVYILPAVIVLILMAAVFVAEKIEPLGPNSLTIIDSIHQYVPFFSDYRNKILSGESLFYTWDVALGSNFVSLASYYLSSPFNLILTLVSQDNLISAVCILIAVKIALSASTMAYFLSNFKVKKDDEPGYARRDKFIIIGLSLCYALSNYVVGYYWNTMWLDCLLIFPLIMLGFERLMEHGDTRMYTLSLFYALFCNYYIGFMICVFLILWFFVYNHSGFKRFIVNGFKFAGCSLLGGAMSAALLIPAYVGISSTAAGNTQIPKWEWYGNIIVLLKQQFILTEPITNQTYDGGVNLYCGTIVFLGFAFFLLCGRIKLSTRIKYLLLLVFLMVSFNDTTLNYIWHGFHDQYGIPNRFSFLYIFVLILATYQALVNLKEIKGVYIMIAIFIAEFVTYMSYAYAEMQGEQMSEGSFVLTFAIILILGMVCMFYKVRMIDHNGVDFILAILMCVEMAFSGIYGFMCDGYADYYENYSTSPQVNAAYDQLKEYSVYQDSFYRVELMESTVLDEASWYNMPSVGTFCSTVLGDVVTTMGRLGFYTGANEFLYRGSTPFTNSLLNIGFLLGRTGDLNNFDFDYIESVDGVDIYENPYKTSIAFAVNDMVKEWDRDEGGRYYAQNVLAYDMTGEPGPFIMKYPLIACSSSTCTATAENEEITFENAVSGQCSHMESFTIPDDGDYYINCRGNGITTIKVYINGSCYANDRYQSTTFHIGQLAAGDYVSVEYCYDNLEAGVHEASLSIATFDWDSYEKVYEKLSENMLEDVTYKQGYVNGRINMPSDSTLFTSIPYDEGWSVYVDGEKVDYYEICGSFIGVDVPTGIHRVEFRYVPKGFKLGAAISIVAWLIFIGTVILYKKSRKKARNMQLTE